jgi:hypothetical protein
MTDERLPLAELLAKSGDGDFLRSVAEAVLQMLMEADVEGLIGAGRHERTGDRLPSWPPGRTRRRWLRNLAGLSVVWPTELNEAWPRWMRKGLPPDVARIPTVPGLGAVAYLTNETICGLT